MRRGLQVEQQGSPVEAATLAGGAFGFGGPQISIGSKAGDRISGLITVGRRYEVVGPGRLSGVS